MKVKSATPSSFFTSQSTRTIDGKLSTNQKHHWPAAGQYETKSTFGNPGLQGGAPTNFLLLKANKSAAPFTSTVPRFQQSSSAKNSLGPGQYHVSSNFDMALDARNNPDNICPG